VAVRGQSWHFAAMAEAETPLSLAGEFPAATREDWRKLVDAALKGAPFERLQSKTYDGLTIAPLYEGAADARAVSGRAPGSAWRVMQRVDHPDPAAANAQAREDVANGASGLVLVMAGAAGANGYGLDSSPDTFTRVFDDIDLAGISIDVELAPFDRDLPQSLADAIKRHTDPAAAVRFGYDPLGAVATSGRMPLPWSETAPLMARLIRSLADAGFKGPFAAADGRAIHDAGGSEAQELACALAGALAYVRALEAGGMALEAARDAIYFRLSADADQFLTMAKFRALRKLWARLQTACGLAPQPGFVAAATAWRMLTRRDPYVNILRNTIAVAAAGLAGADTITVLPHTAALGLPDAFARRIARNIQLVLLEEANLARVADPAAGSGALEALTQQLCTAAWSLFQEIERAGGAWAALQSGLIREKVAAVRAQRQMALARRLDALTGTNIYPDLDEIPPAVLDVPPRPQREPATGARISTLPRIRLAEPFERLRDASDRILAETGTRPKVFLVCVSAASDFTWRTSVAKNLFESGGIEALIGDADPNAAPATVAAAFAAAGAALACVCNSDWTYHDGAAAIIAALKAAGARHIYLASRPGAREAQWRAAGVQSFVYESCDALATLQAAYDILRT
jgi:methylmalonyl-CoA mutase